MLFNSEPAQILERNLFSGFERSSVKDSLVGSVDGIGNPVHERERDGL